MIEGVRVMSICLSCYFSTLAPRFHVFSSPPHPFQTRQETTRSVLSTVPGWRWCYSYSPVQSVPMALPLRVYRLDSSISIISFERQLYMQGNFRLLNKFHLYGIVFGNISSSNLSFVEYGILTKNPYAKLFYMHSENL